VAYALRAPSTLARSDPGVLAKNDPGYRSGSAIVFAEQGASEVPPARCRRGGSGHLRDNSAHCDAGRLVILSRLDRGRLQAARSRRSSWPTSTTFTQTRVASPAFRTTCVTGFLTQLIANHDHW